MGARAPVPTLPIIIYTFASVTLRLWVHTSTSRLRECIKHSIKSSFQVPNSVAQQFQALGNILEKSKLPFSDHNHRGSTQSGPDITHYGLKSHTRRNSFSICFLRIKDNAVHTFWACHHWAMAKGHKKHLESQV